MLPWNVQNVTYFIIATIVTYTNCHDKPSNAWWFKVTFLGWLSDPFKGLSDLQLNHLVLNSESSKGSLGGGHLFQRQVSIPKNCLSDPRKLVHNWNTLPKKNGFAPDFLGLLPQKETIVFQPSIFRCYWMLVWGVAYRLPRFTKRFTYTFVPNWCAWTWRNFTMQDTFWWLFGPVG